MWANLATLLAVLTLGVLSPGPDFLLVLKNSLGRSRAQAFATVAGIALGLVLQLSAIALGFTVITPAVLRAVQLAGAAFLAWVGWRALFAPPGMPANPGEPARRRSEAREAFVAGLGCNLTNPKAFLFYVSLMAQVSSPGLSLSWRWLWPLLLAGHATLVWCAVVLALQSPVVARRLARAQRWLPRIFGVALLVLASWVAVQAW